MKLEEIRVKEQRKKERDDRQKTAKKIKELKRNASELLYIARLINVSND